MRYLFWFTLWVAVSLGIVIGVVQYIAFGTPFTIWAILSAWASGYTACWALWKLGESHAKQEAA